MLSIRSGDLSDVQRAELLADLYSAIDVADDIFGVKSARITRYSDAATSVAGHLHKDVGPEDVLVTADQKARYLERRGRVAYAIEDAQLADETLSELEGIAPAAVTFLVAKRMAEPVDSTEPPFGNHAREVARKVVEYLLSRADAGVELDDRCNRILLRLRWAHVTGERLMLHERGRTPSTKQQAYELLAIVGALNEKAGRDARNRERYLEAVLSWLVNDSSRALEIWRSLSRDTDNEDRSRVVRWLVSTDDNGLPRNYRGRIEKRGETDWQLRIEGIGRPIAVSVRDFSEIPFSHGRELRGFGIAFNYIGPIAHPLSR